MKNKFLLSFILIVSLVVMSACQSNAGEGSEQGKDNDDSTNTEIPVVTMTMESGGKVVAELYPEIAPNTVNNFIELVEDGFYDGVIFHRVIPGFMVQGGDPEGTGMGGPGYSIPGEFNNNGFDNDLVHDRGVLSMARSQDPDSAGSQFFIMVDEAPHLDGDYAGFGKVTDGMDVVDEIVQSERDPMDKPLEDQVIKSMTVELNGYKPKEVKKQ